MKRSFFIFVIITHAIFCVSQNTFNKELLFEDQYYTELAYQIHEKEDGFIFSGAVFHIGARLVVGEINQEGETEWLKIYGNTRHEYQPGNYNSMICIDDSLYIMAITYHDTVYTPFHYRMMLMKFDARGDTMWTKVLYEPEGEDGSCFAHGVIETFDNGFLVFGGEGLRGVVIKTDSLGNKEWLTYYGSGQSNDRRSIYSVLQTYDSGYIASGDIRNPHLNDAADPALIRYYPNGDRRWERSLGGPLWDSGPSLIQPLDDSNYVVLAQYTTQSAYNGDPQRSRIQLVKIKDNAVITYSTLIGGGNELYTLQDFERMSDGSYIACGRNPWDNIAWMYSFSLERDSLYLRMQLPPTGDTDLRAFKDISECSDRGIIACGNFLTSFQLNNSRCPWIIKTDRFGCLVPYCDPNGVFISTQPENTQICKYHTSCIFLSANNALNNLEYHWQIFENNSWEYIENSSVYNGARNDMLYINPLGIDQNSLDYRCRVYNDYWSFFSDSVNVVFVDSIEIINQPENSRVNYFERAEFLVQATEGHIIHYQWFQNQYPIDGANDSLLIIENVSISDTGSYYCELSNACGSILSEVADLTIPDLGIHEPELNVQIFPNPAYDIIRIENSGNGNIISIVLYSCNGEKIKEFDQKIKLLDVSAIPAGIYFLKIDIGQRVLIQKIIIQN